MGWPEDDMDFEDGHDPILANGLTIDELALIHQHLERKHATQDRGGVSDVVLPRRDKIPCPTSEAPKIEKTLPEIVEQLKELNGRQDKLADATLKSLGVVTKRLDKLEARPTPVWALGPLQKSCLLIFVLNTAFFVMLFAMALISHAMGMQ